MPDLYGWVLSIHYEWFAPCVFDILYLGLRFGRKAWRLISVSKVRELFYFRVVSIFLLWSFSFVGFGIGFYLFGYSGVCCYSEFILDRVRSLFVLMLFFCGFIALFYCFHYFSGLGDRVLLFPLVVWFLGVMVVLVFRGRLVLSLIFWEYLGLVSFLLILFYSNGVRARASFITLFASRFGDVCFFILIMWVSRWFDISCLSFLVLILLIVMTKRASFPFISWLLEAMRAPTPVSSLVHSSTLVAAGVWFLVRYSERFSESSYFLLFFFCSLTVVLSGFCASFFNDLKKVVALSTCNKVSWCIIFFICGDLELCLLQLLTHGVCKCFLFMSVGDLMGVSMGRQRAVKVFLPRYSGFFGSFSRVLLIISLSGLPFIGVFFRKHMFFSLVFYCFDWVGLVILRVAFLLTYCYSTRLVLLLVRCSSGNRFGFGSRFLLTSGLVVLGSILNFICSFSVEELTILGFVSSIWILCGQVFGCFIGWFLYSC